MSNPLSSLSDLSDKASRISTKFAAREEISDPTKIIQIHEQLLRLLVLPSWRSGNAN
jgi:hypothetical protein